MSATYDRSVLVLQHVPWEGPGLILDALTDVPIRTITVVDDPVPRLPPTNKLAGVIVMGGPMSAKDDDRFPGLSAERDLLADAVAGGVPVLGVCLGAQLLALALGGGVRDGEVREVGWAPARIHDTDDPLLGGMSPEAVVLHWHDDVFEPPPGSVTTASTSEWPSQAFRLDHAWGIQFHIEVDEPQMTRWLIEATMVDQACEALGPNAVSTLTLQTRRYASVLRPRALAGLGAFADLVRERCE